MHPVSPRSPLYTVPDKIGGSIPRSPVSPLYCVPGKIGACVPYPPVSLLLCPVSRVPRSPLGMLSKPSGSLFSQRDACQVGGMRFGASPLTNFFKPQTFGMLSKPSGSLFSHRDACIANGMLAKLAGCGSGLRPSPIF